MQSAFFLLLTLVLVGLPAAVRADDPQAIEFFEKRIRPLLVARCFDCHGADQAESELRLDSRADMLEGGRAERRLCPVSRTRAC